MQPALCEVAWVSRAYSEVSPNKIALTGGGPAAFRRPGPSPRLFRPLDASRRLRQFAAVAIDEDKVAFTFRDRAGSAWHPPGAASGGCFKQ
jgi:hypothetical protein